MTVLEERLRSRGQVKLPFDSLAVVARHTSGGARSAVVAEAVADDLTAMLARSRSLRIPRAEFVRPYAESDLTPEEIGRELNVRGIALCTIATGEAHVDASLDLIDVMCDELVAHETFLVSNQELIALERVMLHTIAGMRTASHPVTADEGVYAAIVEARVMRARGNAEGALAILKGVAAPLEVAATIVEGRLTSRIGAAREALRGIRGSVPALQLLASSCRDSMRSGWRRRTSCARPCASIRRRRRPMGCSAMSFWQRSGGRKRRGTIASRRS